jgi:hypothetical protein
MIWNSVDGLGLLQRVMFNAGTRLAKAAQAGEPEPAYSLAGMLYLSSSGYLLLSVPNAMVRGIYQGMAEPGIELPPSGPEGLLNAHITVMRPEEIAAIGGADKITERGKQFKYTLGRFLCLEKPSGWPEMAEVYFMLVHSPDLQELRRAYGLSSLPNEGKHAFHVTVAVRRKGVLGRNETSKVKDDGAS